MVRVITANSIINCEDLLGSFLDESQYDVLIDEDCDFYAPPNCSVVTKNDCTNNDCSTCERGTDEDAIVFKLRKNYFSQEEQAGALAGLAEAAVHSQNRGLAAGPRGEKCGERDWVTEFQLDIIEFYEDPISNVFSEDPIQEIIDKHADKTSVPTRGLVWLTNKVRQINFNFDDWLEETRNLSSEEKKKEVAKIKDYISDTTYAAPVFSGVAGWMDRYPRIPYGRATSYTEKQFDKFKLAYPFLQKLSKGFSDLLPRRWGVQKSCIDKIDPAFHVPDTVFTTITVNKSFRTAAHRDAGDLADGFSNLTVITNGKKYSGGYLVLPEFRVAVNVRPGDLLLIANHSGIHGNTPIVLEEEGANRISVVCYFREKMLELGSKQYEDIRFNFIEERRKNQEHPLWRPLWNGISPGVWESKDWAEYLLANGGKEMLDTYHKNLSDNMFVKEISIDDFF